jgi:hypothetical protein
VSTGVRVHTDRASFERWVRALSGVALPEELRPPDAGAGEPVPPLVAASLALHSCAEVAITVRLNLPAGAAFGCFGLVEDLAAGVFRSDQTVEIGLFQIGELVDQVVRLVPELPPAPSDSVVGSVRIAVVGAEAAVAGWQLTLLGGGRKWRRVHSDSDPNRLEIVPDLARELAADLRFALAECLTTTADRV